MKIVNHLLTSDGGEPVSFIKSPHSSPHVSPLYLIMHFTAGTTAAGAVSWFQNPDAQASAHLVIDRDGTLVQMVPFNRRAWHAGKSRWGQLDGMNQYSIGIELVNAGKLRRNAAGQWVNWAGRVVPDAEVALATHKDETAQTGWHEYTSEQLDRAAQVGALLHRTYNFTDVLGHDDVSPGRKVDPGPLFPLNSFRSMVLGRA